MFKSREYPILEFDYNKNAKLSAVNIIEKINVPEYCVITFFREAIQELINANKLKQIAILRSEVVDLPVYEYVYNDKAIGLIQGFVGSAGAAGQLEELIAMGFSKFIVCGGAGVLQQEIQVGHLVIPISAVRDEGTSYHYLEPSREVECNKKVVEVIEQQMNSDNIPYIKAKTWTTDAIYRETEDKIELRKSEGCVTVEMEAAAFFAVSKFRNVMLGQILYGGDDLSGDKWDSRQWVERKDIRRSLVELSMKICLQL